MRATELWAETEMNGNQKDYATKNGKKDKNSRNDVGYAAYNDVTVQFEMNLVSTQLAYL